MSELRIEIQKLLDSEMTGYKINKATGLSQTIISGLRNGKKISIIWRWKMQKY